MRFASTFVASLLTLATAAAAQTQPAGDAGSLAENHWPIGFHLPDSLGGHKQPKPGTPDKADILVWVPEGAKQIRAFLLVPNNTDSKDCAQHPAVRKALEKHQAGIVYMRSFDTDIEGPDRKDPPSTTRVPALMDVVAEKTGIAEFKHAPWITFGKSSRGQFPYRAAWTWPERTIGTITYHGETPTWPVAPYAKLNGETIMSVNINGETEWGGTWFNHVRPSLLNYRGKKGWLSHVAVVRGVGHGDYDSKAKGQVPVTSVWDYVGTCVDKFITLRVPKDKFPTDGPIKLKQVDEASGYLIDPFAVEEMFKVPHLPLVEKDGEFASKKEGAGEDAPVSGYRALVPPAGFTPVDGVPVVKLEPGKSPKEWLITDSLKFAMSADPMLELGDLQKLTPKPGDKVTIDGKELEFTPIAAKHVGPNGGISMKGGLRPGKFGSSISMLAYTVVDVPEKTHVKVAAGYSAAVRVQMVVSGAAVKHKEVLELAPGKHPMLVVLRVGASWDRIEPHLMAASAEDVAAAKEMQAAADRYAAEAAKLAASTAKPVLFKKASSVPAEERKKMFWVADEEHLQAWFNLHNVKGMTYEAPK